MPAPVIASQGDESPGYRSCHARCLVTGCAVAPSGTGEAAECDTACPAAAARGYLPPLPLRALRWDCSADCSYHCMWQIELPQAVAQRGRVLKYHGKWPFVRVLGAQEPASVVLSLANLAVHVHCLAAFVSAAGRHQPWRRRRGHCRPGSRRSNSRYDGGDRRAADSEAGAGGSILAAGQTASAAAAAAAAAVTPQRYPYYWLWVSYGIININAWTWSAVFHCRDTWVTERLDYFSADAAVAAGLFAVVARGAALTRPAHLIPLALAVAAGLSHLVYYMAAVKFDYGLNVAVAVAVGAATALGWAVWAVWVGHPARRSMLGLLLALHAAMLLELLDFPPLFGALDAHALWHATTVPLTWWWWRTFVSADMAWVVVKSQGRSGMASARTAAAIEVSMGNNKCS